MMMHVKSLTHSTPRPTYHYHNIIAVPVLEAYIGLLCLKNAPPTLFFEYI